MSLTPERLASVDIRLVPECSDCRLSLSLRPRPISELADVVVSGPGVCIRLYSREDFDAREAFTAPEIQRTNLAAVILRTINLRLGNIEEFPFLDPPKSTTVREGYKTLEELGAITEDGELTEIGRRMAKLPVDPRISRMILAAVDEHALPEVLPIAAMLESQDPRERPRGKTTGGR
jgi:ATP-dependent helicase HrpA